MQDGEIFLKAIRRVKANGIEPWEWVRITVFLEKEIDHYREKMVSMKKTIKAQNAELIVLRDFRNAVNSHYGTSTPEKERDKTFEKLEITFKSGETITYKSGEWDDYSFTGGAVNVKRGGAWIGIYNFDDVFCVELK